MLRAVPRAPGKDRSTTSEPRIRGGVGYTFGRLELDLPAEPALLKFSVGLRDGSTSDDGEVFKITAVALGKKETISFEKHWQKTEWSEESVDLSEFAGLKTTLTLITDVGPGDDSNSDWACWGNPRIALTGKRMTLQLRRSTPQQGPEAGPPVVGSCA